MHRLTFVLFMSKYIDSYQHKGLRKKLVDLLIEKGITDEAVLAAINAIPRHFFLDSAFDKIAYEDRAFPIGEGQTISQPYTVAYQTQLLQIKKMDKVLEIGTGSGYQAAILSQLARRVYTVDRHSRLVKAARQVFEAEDISNIIAFTADGSRGLPEQAPFDRILLTAASEDPPGPLLAQLRIGGIMVLPVGQSDAVQTLVKVTKTEDGLDYQELRAVRFVPLLEGLGKENT